MTTTTTESLLDELEADAGTYAAAYIAAIFAGIYFLIFVCKGKWNPNPINWLSVHMSHQAGFSFFFGCFAYFSGGIVYQWYEDDTSSSGYQFFWVLCLLGQSLQCFNISLVAQAFAFDNDVKYKKVFATLNFLWLIVIFVVIFYGLKLGEELAYTSIIMVVTCAIVIICCIAKNYVKCSCYGFIFALWTFLYCGAIIEYFVALELGYTIEIDGFNSFAIFYW